MDFNIKDKIYGKINYSAFYKIHKYGSYTIGTVPVLTNVFMKAGSPECVASTIFLMSLFFSLYMYNEKSDAFYHTKEISNVIDLYNEFLNNYNQLNDKFNFDNPVEIYALYNYMLTNGYLSKNKKYKYSNKDVMDFKKILGTTIFSGTGVCRHTSAMLSDIYNNRGIESTPIAVYLEDNLYYIYSLMKENNISIGQLIENRKILNTILNKNKKYLDEININKLIKKIKTEEEQLEIRYKKKELIRKHGNHSIVLAVYKDKNYILDPTNSTMYKYIKDDHIVNIEHEDSFICYDSYFNKFHKDKLKENLCKSSTTFEEDEKVINKTLKICKCNKDILGQFYLENKELYNEVSNENQKVLKVTQKKRA